MDLEDYDETEEEEFKPESDREVGPITMVYSEGMRGYFEKLAVDADRCYSLAQEARKKGFDPSLNVEIPRAQDLAARVEALVGPSGIAERIRELSKQYDREHTAIQIAMEIAKNGEGIEKSADQAIRTGLAILTEGVLVAPLEGVTRVGIKRNTNGTPFLSVYYAGPIRSAGGTGQALSVLIADLVRRQLGLSSYIPTTEEVERLKEEIPAYKQAQHLQYTPTDSEIELIARNCPVMITGEATERDIEVSGHRNLARIETNGIRGGACLVIAEGLCLKAPKIQKHVKRLGIDGWGFIDKLASKGKEDTSAAKPSEKYLEKTLAGRPILAHPSMKGGLRLRYGRSRTGGIASTSVHPALMYILDDFIAIGTQIAIERPGKATISTPCDSIDGPIVLLKNGDLVQLESVDQAKKISKEIKQIVDMGEILIPFGEFAENNKNLLESPYCIEWFEMDFERKAGKKFADILKEEGNLDPFSAFRISEKYNVPLHPDYLLFWHDISRDELGLLAKHILEKGRYENGRLRLPYNEKIKNVLIELCATHEMHGDIIISERYSYPLLRGCGLDLVDGNIVRTERLKNIETWTPPPSEKLDFPTVSTLQLVSILSGIETRARGLHRIGARMGRPEKASERLMKPPPHILFPVGNSGGPQRLVYQASEEKEFRVDIGIRKCSCGKRTFRYRCECGAHTEFEKPEEICIDLKEELAKAESVVKEKAAEMKGVKGTISDSKSAEPLEKGIIRARHHVHVFKDGTSRFDMTNAPLTHFRPKEIGTPVRTLRELGYTHDCRSNPLENEDQILELKPQDVVPSLSCGEYLVRVSRAVDDVLVKMYGMNSFYNAKEPEDLIGHLVIGLAPHTSAGILGRIIGYTDTQVCYAHPFYHAGKRRNADGDSDAVMLLMDALLNFSKSYLPSSRGGLMDAPLVLATNIDPHEIDKESHNLDVLWKYPLEFYEATMRNAHPKEVEKSMRLVGSLLGKPEQYEGFGFTHDTEDISEGVKRTAYATLGSMQEKVDAQFALAEKIRAVDISDLAARVIEKHFLPDMIGNLKKFTTQEFRCTKCGAKYRRVTLTGFCRCGNKLVLTVSEGSVRKYFEMANAIAGKYGVSDYMKQRLNLLQKAADTIFQKQAPPKKCTISDFL